MKILQYIDRAIKKVENWLIIISLTLMVVLTFVNVILRALYTHAHIQWANTLLSQADWSDQLARLMVLWVTFLGASLLTGDNRHIKIDLMGPLLSPRWLSARELILSIGCMVICAFMLNASIDYIKIEMEFGSNTLPGIPSWICQLIIPSGFALILFRFFIRALEQLLSIVRSGRS
ncbi:TRAP transporter small permease [Deltaproteobacteria bacterium]|nr:TRAP transporter small permease [Deltaproteobacteria bacterium]